MYQMKNLLQIICCCEILICTPNLERVAQIARSRRNASIGAAPTTGTIPLTLVPPLYLYF